MATDPDGRTPPARGPAASARRVRRPAAPPLEAELDPDTPRRNHEHTTATRKHPDACTPSATYLVRQRRPRRHRTGTRRCSAPSRAARCCRRRRSGRPRRDPRSATPSSCSPIPTSSRTWVTPSSSAARPCSSSCTWRTPTPPSPSPSSEAPPCLYPVADQPYGDRSGKIRDPWGHNWFIATHTEDVAPDEEARRFARAGLHHRAAARQARGRHRVLHTARARRGPGRALLRRAVRVAPRPGRAWPRVATSRTSRRPAGMHGGQERPDVTLYFRVDRRAGGRGPRARARRRGPRDQRVPVGRQRRLPRRPGPAVRAVPARPRLRLSPSRSLLVHYGS